MIREGKFGVQEAVSLVAVTISVKVFYTSPSMVARFVGTASWYMTLISALVAVLGFTVVFLLLKRFPGKSLEGAFEASLGRTSGFIFSVITSCYLLFVAAMQLRESSEVMKIYVLLESPLSYIVGLTAFAIIVMSFLGLETIARVCKLVVFILLVSFIVVILLASQNFEFHRMAPIFGHGIGNTLIHGIRRSSVYGEVIIIAIIASSLQGTSHIKKAGYISIITSGIIISATLLTFTLTFPYYTASEVVAPIYQMVALISYGVFFERFDAVFLFIWNISTILALTVLFYSSVSMLAKTFRIQDIRPIILPVMVIMFNTAMMPNNLIQVVLGATQNIRDVGWIVFFVLPLAALISAIIRERIGGKKNA